MDEQPRNIDTLLEQDRDGEIMWLEDSTTGRFDRYALGNFESAWFCKECGEEHGYCICEDGDVVNEEEPCWM